MKSRFAVIVLFFSSVGWGLTWLPIKVMTDMGLGSLHLLFFAFLSATITLLPWLVGQFSQWYRHVKYLVLIGFTGGLANVSFQGAIAHGDVVRVMILFYMLPVWSVIGGRIFLKEKIDALRMIAVSLCLGGAFIILDVWHLSWNHISWIDTLAIISGMAWAGTNILFRFTQNIPVMSKVAMMFMGSLVLISLSLLIIESNTSVSASGTMTDAMIYGACWLTLITIGTQWGVTQMEAGRSAVIIVMELVVAVISSAIILKSELSVYELVGGMLVLIAALLEGLRDEKTREEQLAENFV